MGYEPARLLLSVAAIAADFFTTELFGGSVSGDGVALESSPDFS